MKAELDSVDDGTGNEDGVKSDILLSSPLAPSTCNSALNNLTPIKMASPQYDVKDNEEEGEADHNLLEELHRIQGMLGAVMKKKQSRVSSNSGNHNNSNNLKCNTPERDAEVERLRMQLQEQEVA